MSAADRRKAVFDALQQLGELVFSKDGLDTPVERAYEAVMLAADRAFRVDEAGIDLDALRAKHPPADRPVLGVRIGDDVAVVLSLGEPLGPKTRPGGLLVRLLSAGPGPWVVVTLRPGSPAPTAREKDAIDRLTAAAALLGVRVARYVIATDNDSTTIEASAT